jgi:predicted TIM-barrel fold metal-dependent hydrolase
MTPHRRVRWGALALLLLLASCRTAPATVETASSGAEYRYRINDAHCHFVDFLQNTEGAEVLLNEMDKASVDHIVLYGLPVQKKWESFDRRRPLYYSENDARCYYYGVTDVILAQAVKALTPEKQARIHPFICGFNPTDRGAVDHIERMMTLYPGFWQGIGEILTRKGELTPLTLGETSRADHVALDPVYEFAAKNDLPVWIHSNITTIRMAEPLYLHEMMNAVEKHPLTRFVWCHAGHSRELVVPDLVDHVRRAVAEHENLWVDFSWVVFDMVMVKDGRIDPAWVKLIEDYPDRFLVGSDKIGHYGTYGKEIRKYDLLFEALTPRTARKVAAENMWRLLPRAIRPIRQP